MATVYLSSTYKDLQPHREAVARRLRQVPGVTVIAMEEYVAKDERPAERCVADVQAADLYVGIVAWRYGFVPPGETRSITELEFRAAEPARKCLCFVLDPQVPWSPEQTDAMSGENDPARVKALRKAFLEDHSAALFRTPEDLAGAVAVAVVARLPAAPAAAAGPPRPDATPQFRELDTALVIACTPADEALARAWAEVIERRRLVDRKVVLATFALLVEDEQGFGRLERCVTRCEAGLVVVSPASLPALAARADRVAEVLGLMRARLGAVRTLACGADPGALPAAWAATADALLAPGAPPDPAAPDAAAAAELGRWLAAAAGGGEGRRIGLPLCVLAMKASELASLDALRAAGAAAGGGVQGQLLGEIDALAAAGVAWRERYGGTREAWRPFGPDGTSVAALVQQAVDEVNEEPERLRERRIKAQWYPFDVLLAQWRDQHTGLAEVYRDMARTGCVLVVDELSLLNADLVEAFRSSPLVNNPQVAMVTISPDPRRSPLEQILEAETRRKLVGVLERYERDCDPRCELAVSDPRRLRRWFHTSLPETAASLRDPRPNADKLEAFFRTQLGPGAPRRSGDDYVWARGGQP